MINESNKLKEKKFSYIVNCNHFASKELDKEGFYCGRMISASKSSYHKKYPNNEIYFNGNIFIIEEQKIQHGFDETSCNLLIKIFYGDLDATRDIKKLQKIANKLKSDFYILREYDGRFNYDLNANNVKDLAAKIINCEK